MPLNIFSVKENKIFVYNQDRKFQGSAEAIKIGARVPHFYERNKEESASKQLAFIKLHWAYLFVWSTKRKCIHFLFSEIVQLVANAPKSYMPPYRPKIDETAFEDINDVMVKCWAEDPNDRPVFSALKANIRKINR